MRTYLRYELEAAFGVVVSGQGHVAVDASGRLAVAPALEAVAVWNIKTGALEQRLVPQTASPAEVTALALGGDGDTLAVGHADGAIRLWRLADGTERLTLHGHKSAVLALRLSRDSTTLVSGAKDTAVIVWDVVAESGVCRLRGHRDAVTDVCLLEEHRALASVSKDGSLRVWDLRTQQCVQNVAAPSGELWSVDADAECTRLITGGASAELLAWRLEPTTLAHGLPSTSTQTSATQTSATQAQPTEQQQPQTPQPPTPAADAAGGETGTGAGAGGAWRSVRAVHHGPLAVRASTSRVVRLRFGLDDTALAVQFGASHR
jgi:WD40 repeat protein